MQWREFAEHIELPKEAVAKMQAVPMTEESYRKIRLIYERDHHLFFEEVKKRADAPMHFMLVYCKMACEVYDQYKEEGMDEEIFWDTFQDIRFWCENYKKEYGTYGIGEYDWFWRHIDMTLFRLGRLQYEEMTMPYGVGLKVNHLPKGIPVINIHIPQGERLDIKSCEESFQRAYKKYGRGISYVCHSWLLYPGLWELLSEESNILKFQQKFRIIEVDYKEREAERRIFGTVQGVVKNYPEETSLQRSVKEYLLKGNTLGNGWGILI